MSQVIDSKEAFEKFLQDEPPFKLIPAKVSVLFEIYKRSDFSIRLYCGVCDDTSVFVSKQIDDTDAISLYYLVASARCVPS